MATQSSDLQTFRTKTRELSVLAYSEHEDARNRLNAILDLLNSLDYSAAKFVEHAEGEKALANCCRVVPVSKELLVAKFCQLVVNVTFKQQITLGPNAYGTVMTYLVHSVEKCSQWVMVDLLRAMGSLLYHNGEQSEKFNSKLLGAEGILLTLTGSKDEDVKRTALQCMENMCMRALDGTVMSEDYLRICSDYFIQTLYEPRLNTFSDLGYCRILIAAFKGLTHTMSNQKNILQDRVGEVLGAVKTFMLFNGEPVSPSPLFATLVSQQDSVAVPKPKPKTSEADPKKNKKKKKKAQKKETKEPEDEPIPDLAATIEVPKEASGDSDPILQPSWRVSSESEYSDPEGGAASKLRSYMAKTRICALGCLMGAIKSCERRLLFGYWTHFLPDSSNRASLTLFTCALKDRNHKCRLTALTALSSLLEGSKQFLSAADDTDQTKTAFTPYSTTLGSMVKELHVNLLHALISEQMALPITQIIKCLGVLVENTSYQKLKPGLLSRVVKQIRPFLSHRDTNIRVACLTCIGSVLSVQAPLLEVSYILEGGDAGKRMNSESEKGDLAAASPTERSPLSRTPHRADSGFLTPTGTPTGVAPNLNWLVAKSVRSINLKLLQPESERTYEPLPVRLESLQVLTHLVQGYFACVRKDFKLLQDVVIFCLEDSESPVQLHGAKLLEALGNVISPHPSAAIPHPSATVKTEDGAEFWIRVLSGPLSTLLQKSAVNVVRATGCDCLSTIGAEVFALFPFHLRTLCMTLLLGFTMDTDHVTRSSAIRTLGVYVMYPCLRDDVSFVADVANAVLILLEDSSIIVRIKTAWSLGNVSDAMCANKDANDEDFLSDFSDLLLFKMLQGALKSCQDSDKIRIHAVRALGNILRYMPLRPLEKPSMIDMVAQAMQTLVKSVGTGAMKVRWNACYALGNVLKNEILPIGKADWTPAIFSSLGIAVRDCKNFKVRINAALALSQLTSRRQLQHHSDQIEMIWSSLIQSLQSMDTITDFADFKLRDRLPDQICCTLIHLIPFLVMEDLTAISKSVSTNLLLLVESMEKYWPHVIQEPERVSKIQKAQEHLQQLKVTCSDQYRLVTVQNLISVFTQPEVAVSANQEAGDETPGLSWQMTSSRSAFRDTYD